jgi:hypothetical protein
MVQVTKSVHLYGVKCDIKLLGLGKVISDMDGVGGEVALGLARIAISPCPRYRQSR